MGEQEESGPTPEVSGPHDSASATTCFDLEAPQDIPNYKLGRELGHGGMSVVYAARSRLTDEHVAIKLLYPYFVSNRDLVNRLLREIDVLRRFEHPNIVRYLDSGERQNCYYFVMEFLEGETLEERLERDRRLDEKEACEIILAVASGLAEAHRHSVFHRDVKPGNIFLCKNGDVKLVDFGLAKDESDSYQTQMGLVIGTPLYLAPEQARGETAIDGRVDVYSLGITLYHCVTGTVPFEELSVPLILTKKTTEPIPSARSTGADVSDGIDSIIASMCERDVNRRYPNVDAVLTDLRRHLEGQAPLFSTPGSKKETVVAGPARLSTMSSVLADPILKSVIVESRELTQQYEYPADHVIFYEGDMSKEVYLLVKGEVEVLKAGFSIDVIDQAGAFFGEMSGLLGVPRSTTIRTRTKTQVVRIDPTTFSTFLESFPSLNYRLAVMLAERVHRTTGRYYQLRTRFRNLQRHLNAAQGLLED